MESTKENGGGVDNPVDKPVCRSANKKIAEVLHVPERSVQE
jgi:hypothetical protein